MSSEVLSLFRKILKGLGSWVASILILWATHFALFWFFMPDAGYSSVVLIAILMSILLTLQMVFETSCKAAFHGIKMVLAAVFWRKPRRLDKDDGDRAG